MSLCSLPLEMRWCWCEYPISLSYILFLWQTEYKKSMKSVLRHTAALTQCHTLRCSENTCVFKMTSFCIIWAFCLTGSRACLIIRKPKCAIKPNLWTQGLHSNGWLMYWLCFIHIVGKHTNEWRCKVKLIMKIDFSISWNPTKSDEKCKAQSCCKKPSIMLILRSIRACKYLSFGLVVIWKCILFF